MVASSRSKTAVRIALPLSMGQVIDNLIHYGYHGLVYDCSDKCIHVPGHTRVPRGARKRAYLMVERDQFIPVCMGDLERADTSKIVSFPRLSDPTWGFSKVLLRVKANYMLIFDNLLDLSHVVYVHSTTIGNAPVAEDATIKTMQDENNVRGSREMVDAPPPKPTWSSDHTKSGPIAGRSENISIHRTST